jgi:arabinose-5-phosphate isomerase
MESRTLSNVESADLDPIAYGRFVLRCEGDALHALSEALDGEFAKAVDILLATSGKIVVSGMGKSGHVGGKIP